MNHHCEVCPLCLTQTTKEVLQPDTNKEGLDALDAHNTDVVADPHDTSAHMHHPPQPMPSGLHIRRPPLAHPLSTAGTHGSQAPKLPGSPTVQPVKQQSPTSTNSSAQLVVSEKLQEPAAQEMPLTTHETEHSVARFVASGDWKTGDWSSGCLKHRNELIQNSGN